MSKNFVRVNEYEDVLMSTDLLAAITPLLNTKLGYWKWTIVAAHNAAQGAIVCSVQDTAGTNILRKKSRAEKIDWLNNLSGPEPKEFLADFKELLALYKKQYPDHGITDEQTKCLHKLNDELRNNFVHFTPQGWSIEVKSLQP
jgi:hypothetical protein